MSRARRFWMVFRAGLVTFLTTAATFPEPNMVHDGPWWYWPFIATLWAFLAVDVFKPAAQK